VQREGPNGKPSIIPKVLESLADFYGEYDRDIIAKLMDLWPASSRTPKLKIDYGYYP
jgi:hypothetical protein